MGFPSKEENVLELFFNESSKRWHFEEIIKTSKLSRDKANKWLKKSIKEEIIKKIKEKGKMPYYVGNFSHPAYKSRKRIYTLDKFYKSGFLSHLMSLSKAKTVIIFGSFARADWNTQSDIDLFIYGNDADFEQGKYESTLKREIQIFKCENEKEFKELRPGLFQNILTGYVVKGDLEFVGGLNG